MNESILMETLNNYLKSHKIEKLESIPWEIDVEPHQNQVVIKCFNYDSLSHLISHPKDSYKIQEFLSNEKNIELVEVMGDYKGAKASYFIFKEISN